jgi:N-acetylneuraminic acid mutarotase
MWNQAAVYRRRRRTFAVSVVLVLLLIIIIASASGGGTAKRVVTGVITLPVSAAPLTYSPAAALLAPILASAAAPIPGKTAFTLLGGLDSSNDATSGVATIDASQTKVVGELPVSLFAAAAVTVGDTEYLFGGAEGTAKAPTPEPEIYSYAVAGSGTVADDGKLPTANYGLGAAVIGHTVYLVGGDSGSATLDGILSWTPGSASPVSVGHLPVALRYAAVTAVGQRLVIAGGMLASGAASKAIYVFEAATDRLHELKAKLPAGLFSASAATLGNLAYVLGGAKVTGVGSASTVVPVSTIYSVDPATGVLATAGSLQYPLAEGSATVVGQTIYIAGGLSDGNAVSYVGMLNAPVAATKTKPTSRSKT